MNSPELSVGYEAAQDIEYILEEHTWTANCTAVIMLLSILKLGKS